MKLPCEVIRDLLPLYHDSVCSEESGHLVETHLECCEACAAELRRMEEALDPAHLPPEGGETQKALSSVWKRVKKRSFVKGCVLAALLCALLIGGALVLTQWKCIPVSAELLEAGDLSVYSDGCIYFTLSIHDQKNLSLTQRTVTDDGCYYVTPMRSVIETNRPREFGGFQGFHFYYPPGYSGELNHPGFILPEGVKKIYIGPVGDGILVWEEGMTLPEAVDESE